MVREIVHIQAGLCGNQIGSKFWEVISKEHGIDPSGAYHGDSDLQLEKINVYFNEASGAKFVPRAVLVDLDYNFNDSVCDGQYGQLFDRHNFAFGQSGAGNNWAKGYYNEGQEFAEYVLDVVRKEAESCDALLGFQLVHSLGGGTGAGLGSLLLNKLREEYPDRVLSTFSIAPSTKVSDNVAESYNCALSVNQLVKSADAVFCIDNEALYDISCSTFKHAAPTYGYLNHFISMAMSGITSSLRFSCQLNPDLRKLAGNLVPFPRLKFLTTTFAPLTSSDNHNNLELPIHELISGIFDHKNMMVSCAPSRGVYLAASAHFCGNMDYHTVHEQMHLICGKKSSDIVNWIPNNLKFDVTSITPPGLRRAASLIGNTTAFRHLFTRVNNQVQKFYSKRAFLQWYINEGLEATEFDEAISSMTNLIQEYEMYETIGVDKADVDKEEDQN